MSSVLLLALLVGCGKPFVCDFCGKEATGKKHTGEVFGVKMTICDDCYKDINALAN